MIHALRKLVIEENYPTYPWQIRKKRRNYKQQINHRSPGWDHGIFIYVVTHTGGMAEEKMRVMHKPYLKDTMCS